MLVQCSCFTYAAPLVDGKLNPLNLFVRASIKPVPFYVLKNSIELTKCFYIFSQ